MKRILLVLLALMVCFGLSAQVKFSGSTGATVYHDDEKIGVLDADQDVKFGIGPVSLALNAGYTYTFLTAAQAISFGCTLSATQTLGPFTFAGDVTTGGLSYNPDTAVLAGEAIGAINASAAFVKDAVSAKLVSLFSGLKAGPFFKGVDLSATYAPKWGNFTVGGTYLDKTQAAVIGAQIAVVNGLSFYAKAKVTY